MPLVASILFGFVPMFFFAFFIYWLDRYEKEPKALLTTVFFWGVIVAAGGAFHHQHHAGIGSLFHSPGRKPPLNCQSARSSRQSWRKPSRGWRYWSSFSSSGANLIRSWTASFTPPSLRSGFAAAENSFYIFARGYQEDGWTGFWVVAFVRIVLVGLQHPFYTSFIGIGLAVSRHNRQHGYHPARSHTRMVRGGLHPCLSQHPAVRGARSWRAGGRHMLDWTGWIAMAGFAVWATQARGRHIEKTPGGGSGSRNHLIASSSRPPSHHSVRQWQPSMLSLVETTPPR